MIMSSGTQLTTMATDTHLDSTTNEAGMASTASTASTQVAINGQGQMSTKKKFGKNLNKLNAPPTAPLLQGGTKTNASAKNGLLLLSNKRSSSVKNAVATSAASIPNSNSGGGILSSKATLANSKPLPNLGLHTEYNPSTHDALMGVVVGASRMEAQQQPDAWGVADKHHEVTRVDLSSPHHEMQEAPLETAKAEESLDSVDSSEKNHGHSKHNDEEQHHPEEFRSSNWDEYGGREAPGESDENVDARALVDTDIPVDDQGVYMSKLAKERAERGWGEEETRILLQKERAAQRLRDLEEKIASKQVTTSVPRTEDLSVDLGRQSSASDASPRERRSPRKLFDPSEPGKSYSALVRGSSSPIQDHGLVTTNPQNQESTPTATENTVKSVDPQPFHRNQNVIQLASYDATDRGARGVETGPRMLFDPKSGSMVEVSSRDDGDEKKNNRRLRKKKGSVEDGNDEERTETKGLASRKDEGNEQQRGKGYADAMVKPRRDNRKGNIAVSRRLPRTCGVLFSRDKRGNFVSADRCDGDLGYGVHSVPGGKVKNSDAYSDYVQSQKQARRRNGSRNERPLDSKENPKSSLKDGHKIPETKPPTLDWVKPNEKIELITGVDESPTLQATAREWAPRNANYKVSEHEHRGLVSVGSMDDHDDDDEDEPVSACKKCELRKQT
jgi:hypothetical protein